MLLLIKKVHLVGITNGVGWCKKMRGMDNFKVYPKSGRHKSERKSEELSFIERLYIKHFNNASSLRIK